MNANADVTTDNSQHLDSSLVETVNQWLVELQRPQGADYRPLELDALGGCPLQIFDELGSSQLLVQLLSDGRVAVLADLGASKDLDDGQLHQLLVANYLGTGTGGATLSIHPQTKSLLLSASLPIDVGSSDRFQAMIAGVQSVAGQWRSRLGRPAANEECIGDNRDSQTTVSDSNSNIQPLYV